MPSAAYIRAEDERLQSEPTGRLAHGFGLGMGALGPGSDRVRKAAEDHS